MYGTLGRVRVRPENRAALVETLTRHQSAGIPGFVRAYLMFPENEEDRAVLVAMFEDRDSYWRNADDPAQNERYLEYRALMEEDPEWSDGEWVSSDGS